MVQVVVSDTCILINLCIAGCLELLGALPGCRFVVPREVAFEMRRGRGRRFTGDFNRAVNLGHILVEDVSGLDALAVYVRCIDDRGLDAGEAAGIALAVTRGWLFATVDAAAYECASELIGGDRVVHLEDILDAAVVAGQLSMEDLEGLLRTLEVQNQYRRRA